VDSGDNRPAATLFNSFATGRVSARRPSPQVLDKRLLALLLLRERTLLTGYLDMAAEG
jgi:hypothetical protein